MPDNNPAFVQFGQGDAVAKAVQQSTASIVGYTQVAGVAGQIAFALGIQREVTFATIAKRGAGAAPELTLDANGFITIPAAVTGQWTVLAAADMGAATDLMLEGRLYDGAGNIMTVANTGYPTRAMLTGLAVAGRYGFPPFPLISKTDTTQAWQLRFFGKSLIALNVNALDITLRKIA